MRTPVGDEGPRGESVPLDGGRGDGGRGDAGRGDGGSGDGGRGDGGFGDGAEPGPPGAPAASASGSGESGAPSSPEEKTSDWFAPRKPPRSETGSGSGNGTGTSGTGIGTGSFDVSGAVASGPLGTGAPQGDPNRGDLPYFNEGPEGSRPPSGPTGGPVTGDSPL
ncbi:hypothetical protein G3I23_29585, partial [Streptomyces sp. SID10115]|nr:hypothetical protein [Streptomyces sp. SID10115]